MANFVDIFQDGTWKQAVVIAEVPFVDADDKDQTRVTYLDPVSYVPVTVVKSALPLKSEAEAKAIREGTLNNNPQSFSLYS